MQEIKQEELDKVNGGFDVSTLYYLNQIVKAVSLKYNMWLEANPTASKEERLLMVEQFINEVYNCLDEKGKRCIDELKNNYQLYWEQIIGRIANS